MFHCRFCHRDGMDRDGIKYSLRHYAHPACYLDAGKKLESLSVSQIEKLPFGLLKDRGLLEQAEAIIAQYREDVERRNRARELRLRGRAFAKRNAP